jgi:hypothetical protein
MVIGQGAEVFERDLMRVFRACKVLVWSQDGDYAYAPTGELYWQVTSAGRATDGDRLKFFPSEQRAHREYDHKVRNILQLFECPNGQSGPPVVYFRARPQFIADDAGDFCVTSRFLISCRPQIYPARYNDLFGPKGP